MGVAEEMCGRSSHEAMLRVQDAELRLLDSVHHFVLMRVDNDRKYAAGLAKILHATVAKGGDAEFVECCTVFKAWETVIKETERLMKCVRAKTEHLATHTLEVLTQLMTEKKAARRKYADDRHRLDADFAKVQEEVSRLRQEYQKAVERLALDRARYLELVAKGKLKSGQKCDEAKSKFFRSAVRLHKLHNDYVLALHTAQGHQTALRERVLPALVQGHLDTQEATVYKTKYVLQDLLRQTDPSSPDFLSISHNLQDALALVIPGSEYTTGFTQLHKSPLPPETEFTFDPRLLEDYTGTLTPDLIEVNELTADSLNHRLTRLTEDIEQMREELSRTSQLQQTSGLELSSLTSGLSDQSDVELLNSYIDKRASVNHHNKQIQEMEGQLGKLERLAALVRAPLEQLGTEPPPPALDVQEAGEGMWETSAPSLTPAALTSSLKDTHFIKSLSKMNPFKKAAGRAATSSSSSNLSVGGGEEEDRRSMHEDGGHAEEGRKKQTHSYERSEPFLNNSNGPDRTSMVKMKEQGHMVVSTHWP
ncbi:tyrosine-protein kinase Fer [Aplysia californica]|uniref:Tyrosine-protein kinase Fer n=1 Tax=Aplysia californica TaxID=6500 RepID=A0ABM1AEN4_APLCA|nr:tyrosine-protein kinase Fer [Aplysia californica]